MRILLFLPLALCASVPWSVSRGGADFHILHQNQNALSASLGYGGMALGRSSQLVSNLISVDTNSTLLSISKLYLPAEIGGQITSALAHWQGRSLQAGVVMFSQSFDPIQGYDDYARPTAEFAVGHSLLGLDLGYNWNGLYLGTRFSWLHSEFADVSSHAFLTDLQFQYNSPWEISWALQAKNFGLATPYQWTDPVLPLQIQSGLAWEHSWNSYLNSALVGDVRYRNDEGLAYPLGLELDFLKMIQLRSGYEFKYKLYSPTAGLGLHFLDIRLDYAWVGRDVLGSEHRFSLTGLF